MAKRKAKSPSPESAPTPAPESETTKARGGSRARVRREVGSEMATGQDQAAAQSDAFVGVPNTGEEPVQAETSTETTTPTASTDSVSMSSEPSAEDIRMRAYHRYLERGGGHGMHYEDWLEAERDLKPR